MIFTYTVDQVFCMKHGLNLAEGSVYGGMRDLPNWAESMVFNGETYYFASRSKMCEELPLVTDKPDTMYRHFKSLVKKGVIKHTKVGKKDFVHLVPAIAKTWNRAKDVLPRLGKKSESELGKKSDILELPESLDNTPLTPQGELSAKFDEVRKKYPGTKRGLRPEFETLKKAAKKAKVAVADLIGEVETAIENQKVWRAQLERKGKFVPQWPHLSTWLNQQRWTEEPPEGVVVRSIGGVAPLDVNPDSSIPAAAWKEWPQVKGWTKTHIPGTYSCPLNGPMDFKTMIANRMARPEMFPSALLANQTQAAA